MTEVRVGDTVRITLIQDVIRVTPDSFVTDSWSDSQGIIWRHNEIETLEIVSRKRDVQYGDLWLPKTGMMPVYFNGEFLVFPAGCGGAWGIKEERPGSFTKEEFFDAFPEAMLISRREEYDEA